MRARWGCGWCDRHDQPRACVRRPRTNEQVVEVVEFDTTDPALRGEMTITLADADGGTDILAMHDGLPRGVPTADNEAGWRSSLAKLAALVEEGS
jgi:hypothetical protein